MSEEFKAARTTCEASDLELRILDARAPAQTSPRTWNERLVNLIHPPTSGSADCDWLHLIGHGTQEELNSGLHLPHNQRFNLMDFARLSNKGAAILSACSTACGHVDLSDEAVHMAAPLQQAGCRSVVATLWPVQGSSMTALVRRVYEAVGDVNKSGTGLDISKVARAVNEALVDQAKEDQVDWVPIAHFGA